MIASLPMYDAAAATRAANDRFWALIRHNLGDGPTALDRHRDTWSVWRDPCLVLSQTCGLPYRAHLHGRVTLVGTPDYGLPGCPPGYYRSVIVARPDDRRTRLADFCKARVARNDPLSQSGWGAILSHAAEKKVKFSPAILDTGSHAQAAQAVADGQADLAAIDAVSWAHLQRDAPHLHKLRVLEMTRPTPGLPFITARGRDPEPLFTAIARAISALAPGDRARLMLKGLQRIPAETYLALPLPADTAQPAPEPLLDPTAPH